MKIKDLIFNDIKKNSFTTAKAIMKKTGFSRVYVNKIMHELMDEGIIALIGKTKRAKYIFLNKANIARERKKILSITKKLYPSGSMIEEHAVLEEIRKQTGIFTGLKKNVDDIIDYAFSEMLNNALEHSGSAVIEIYMKKNENSINFNITDRGIGIFNSIRSKFGLSTDEAIGELLKGKLTTAPEGHSGEGIFFTSRAADIFSIHSEGKKIVFNNILEDRWVRTVSGFQGTRVIFNISHGSDRNLTDCFNAYTDDEFEFSKTMVAAKMYKFSDKLLSRSQARRITAGLEKFKTLTLDFKGVDIIGQGFADEIFRVWAGRNPGKVIGIINANEDVKYMIERAKANN